MLVLFNELDPLLDFVIFEFLVVLHHDEVAVEICLQVMGHPQYVC